MFKVIGLICLSLLLSGCPEDQEKTCLEYATNLCHEKSNFCIQNGKRSYECKLCIETKTARCVWKKSSYKRW